MEIRHPDPSVYVELSVKDYTGKVQITYRMYNLKDTTSGEPIERQSPWDRRPYVGFNYFVYAGKWPGERLARMFIVGCWMAYVEHEALELVSLDRSIYYNPHDHSLSPYQMIINRVSDFSRTFEPLQVARRYFDEDEVASAALDGAFRAERELAIESDWVRTGEIGG